MLRGAIVQAAPIPQDKNKCLDKGIALIDEAVQSGAKIVVFGEGWFCGYPAWIDHCRDVARWDHQPVKQAWADIIRNSFTLTGSEIQKLQEVAEQHQIVLVFGWNEYIEEGPGNSTLFNSYSLIDAKGEMRVHHRKLMPTFNEKLIHGLGDGFGLKVADTAHGRIGGLICWEHWMPLARQAMHNQAEDIHIALWPMVLDRHLLASKHYAFEGRCYVVAAGQIAYVRDMPAQLDPPAYWDNKEDFVLRGGSCVIGPNGELIQEQVYDLERVIVFELPDKDNLVAERMNLAVSGHYQRPDVFRFVVNHDRQFNS